LLGLVFVLLPFFAPYGERSPLRRPWAVGVVLLAAVSISALVVYGNNAPWSPDLSENLALPASVTNGLSPGAAQGAQSFQQRGCLNCHTIAGVGGQRGPDLTHIGSQLSSDQLTWRILNGGRNMPAYGTTVSPEELANLVEFLSTRQ
jgi:ubiquinol-cytochrome c reductase cytochrome b subunit